MPQDPVTFVLSLYPMRFRPISPVQRLGNAGGSSGAALWRYRAADGEMAIRAWPRQGPTLARLELIHKWLKELSEPDIVALPVPVAAADGRTVQQYDGIYWEVTRWLPGTPATERPPRAGCVESAFTALASLHRRLSAHGQPGTSPGLRLRIGELDNLAGSGLDRIAAALEQSPADAQAVMGKRWAMVARGIIPRLLPPLRDACRLQVTLQPCLRDARPEHFLYEAGRVSGLVDFGAMGIETVAADLARLIGEWFADDPSMRAQALAAYSEMRPLDASEIVLIDAFESAADVLIAGHWLTWHHLEHRRFDDPEAVARGIAAGCNGSSGVWNGSIRADLSTEQEPGTTNAQPCKGAIDRAGRVASADSVSSRCASS